MLAVPDHERDLISNVHLIRDWGINDLLCWSESDGVTLQEIMLQQISSNDYAFLSAGQTSIGDEISDEAINIAAATLATGYRGVWGKTRHVKDQHCPRFDEITSGDTVSMTSGKVNENEVPLLDHIHTEKSRKSFRDMYNSGFKFWFWLFFFFLFFFFPLLDL